MNPLSRERLREWHLARVRRVADRVEDGQLTIPEVAEDIRGFVASEVARRRLHGRSKPGGAGR